MNKAYLTGTLPVNKIHLTGTVPVNKAYLTGTVPVNKTHLTGKSTCVYGVTQKWKRKTKYEKKNQ